jgi:MYXO-CTERM domain-containing protein
MLPTIVAFCGFYVAGSGQQLTNDATQVVLMREGTRTVLSMQNDYKGPPDAFAMVVPVPVVLHEGDVKTLPKDVFAHVEAMGAPRLVEYWEQDPCQPEPVDEGVVNTSAPAGGAVGAEQKPADLGVKIEAKFTVGEYQIVILSAKDSTGLETWLHDEHYNVPAGAEPLLRPYVEGGMKFFVAKVDPAKVKFENGHAALSPLRFHYDDEHFTLPIRLGLANSAGTQDLIVNILAPNQRYQVANYPNVTIPTNLDVRDDVKDHFGAFYAALFDRTLEKHPGAIVTEYAWQASSCDPCPGPTLDESELMTLGADVIEGQHTYDLVLTRLHARYGKELKDDLVFTQAPAIAGGREYLQSGGQLEQGAQSAQTNTFQGRYAIRHAWTGPIRCEHPRRGVWGGPPPELAQQATAVKPALGLAFAPRGAVKLAAALVNDEPDLGVHPDRDGGTKPKSGCGCQTSDPQGALVLGLGTALLLVRRPGRRRKR